MKFTITDGGIAAAAIAESGGFRINITTYKVGSGVAYSPSQSDTALHGSVLYTGTPHNYSVVDTDTVQYDLLMDETVGNFSYGEIGLFLEDGTLFALSARDTVQQKLAIPTPGYNVILVEARLRMSNISSVIEYTVLNLSDAKLLEIGSVDNLQPPIISDTNAYICHSGDDYGNPILTVRNSDYRWGFVTHQKAVSSGAVTAAFQADTVSVDTAGSGYNVDDILTVSGGAYTVRTTLRVTSIDGSGGVTGVSVETLGVYTTVPGSPVSVTVGTAAFNLTFVTANTGYQFYSSVVADLIDNVQAGKYILQFTSPSGNLRGVCRNVSASSTNLVRWSTPLIQAPTVGDTFEIFRSNASILDEALIALSAVHSDTSLINAIIFSGED